jgi:stage II sporulation protein D
VKGSLESIQITKTGVSPRIVTANVVGSAGTTRVTGSQLQSALGLYSTWMSFTTTG